MAEFVSKNGIVDAIQYTGKNRLEIENFAGGNILYTAEKEPEMYIRTTNGIIFLASSVWVVKLKHNRFVTVSNDDFTESYELR